MTLTDRLGEYVRACFTGLWIQSHEHPDALLAIAQLCRHENWQLATWDIEQGLQVPGAQTEAGGSDPLAAIRAVNSLATPDGTALLILENFHRFLQSAEIVQAVARQVIAGRQNRTILVVLAPIVQLPVELEKLFVVIEHELPDRQQLVQIARGIATEESELPQGRDLDAVLDAAAGLTRLEAENAFSLSLVRQGRVTPEAVWELKTQTLRKSGSLELPHGEDDFSSLGGLSALKAFCKRALLQPGRSDPRRRPRGVLLLSPPGCGKSQFCKTLIFFLDLPGREEKQLIWEIYLRLFEIEPEQRMPDDADWTGAEIRACCRLSVLLDVPLVQAAENVVPVARTAREQLEQQRSWASGRCLSAQEPGLYTHAAASSGRRRRVSRDPSAN